MNKRSLIAVSVMTCAVAVMASDSNIGANRGLLRTTSAQTLGAGNFTVGAGFRFAQDEDFVRGQNGGYVIRNKDTQSLKSDGTNRLFSTNLYAGIGAGRATDLTISLPYFYELTEWGSSEGGLGDLVMAAKINPFNQEKLFSFGFGVKATLPTGIRDNGYFARHAYSLNETVGTSADYGFTGGDILVEPELFLTGNFSKLKLHLNAGNVVNTETLASTLTSAAGLEFLPTERLSIFTEVSGEVRANWFSEDVEFKNLSKDVLYWSTGVRHTFKNGIFVLGAADIGISDETEFSTGANDDFTYEQYGTPRWGGAVAIGWNGSLKPKDVDGDSIPNKLDQCPTLAEDKDGFEDADGCPDLDNDGDGIPDSQDKCPNGAEDKDGFQDEDGCPDLDNDADGLADSQDKCPGEAEDKDGFQDEDGCPDLDNDADGVWDISDKCANDVEDKDGFNDEDGCPESDNDEDGIVDLEDKCPNAKGSAEDNGCPKVKEFPRAGLVLSGVNFELGKAVLTESSSKTLDEVAASLVAWVEVKVEIQGHTDSTGSAEKNLSISQERADAVKAYLNNKGVEADRMIAKGYGKEVPVADNKTKEGRAKNRRVELKRID